MARTVFSEPPPLLRLCLCLCENILHSFCKSRSPFSVNGFPDKSSPSIIHVANICCRLSSCSPMPKTFTETALLGFADRPGKRWFRALFLLHRKYPPDHLKNTFIQNLYSLYIAGTVIPNTTKSFAPVSFSGSME